MKSVGSQLLPPQSNAYGSNQDTTTLGQDRNHAASSQTATNFSRTNTTGLLQSVLSKVHQKQHQSTEGLHS